MLTSLTLPYLYIFKFQTEHGPALHFFLCKVTSTGILQGRAFTNSAAYLDSWIATLKQEPSFILTVMSDVEKASKLILDKVAI